MTKNKFFALLIIIFMLLSVSGCGGGGNNVSRFADTPISQDKPVPEIKSDDIPIIPEPSPQSQDKSVEPVPTPTPTPEPIISHDPFPEPARYTVSFNSNGGSTVPSIRVTNGGTVEMPENPTLVGYVFAGWYKDEAFTEMFMFGADGDKITKDTTLYAQWINADTLRAEYALGEIVISYANGDNPKYVTKNLMLPAKVDVSGDVNISWSSSNASAVSSSGAVTRPSGHEAEVTLTATAFSGSQSAIRTFDVKVIRARSRESNDVPVVDVKNIGSGDLSITYKASSDQIADIEGNYSSITIQNADDALDAIQGIHVALGINNPYEELETFLVTSDSYSYEYSFQQVYKSVKVFGRSIMASTNASGEGDFLHSSFLASSVLDSADMRINLSASEAENRAKANYSGIVSADTVRTEQIVYSLEDYENAPVYAYIVRVYGMSVGDYIDDSVFINADTGEIITRYTNICDAVDIRKASGKNEFGDDVSFDDVYEFDFQAPAFSYIMRDPNLHIKMNNYLRLMLYPVFSISNTWKDAHHVTVYSNMREIMQWWKDRFERDSLDGNGTNIDIVAHALGRTDNASWIYSIHRIYTYDRAEVSSFDHFCGADVDTLTHETTHATLQYITGNLPYENATGAINEGYADIFACIKDKNWEHGERLFDDDNKYNLDCMRNIASPLSGGVIEKPYQLYTPLETIYADYKKGGEDDHGKVHERSFKVSHAAYLMHISNDVNGLTWKELGDVWYKSMHKGLNATSKFEDVCRCVLWAASELSLPYSKIAIIDSAFSQLGYGSNASLTGKVTDYDTHLPIPGVLIRANVGNVSKNIFADDNGNFSITFPQGNCALEIVNYGYVTFSTNLKLENIASWNGKELNVQMVRSGTGSINGIINRLTIPATPFEGVTLKIRANWNNQDSEPILTTTTDANGKYSFDLGSNGAGYYTIEMIKEGYETSTFNVTVSGATEWQSEYLIGEEKPIINPISPDVQVSPDVSAVSGDIPIDEEHFPDKSFRAYVSYYFDKDNNDVLSAEEIKQVTYIDISGSSDVPHTCSSLKGIEYFRYLQHLDCYYNLLTELDVSGCAYLQSLDCGSNLLNALNVSGCVALQYLYCSYNKLTELDVSSCTALQYLNCSNNWLTTLNFGGSCTALKDLDCYNNLLTTLNVSGCINLLSLNCNNNKLSELNVNDCIILTFLYCGHNQLKTLNLSSYTTLFDLYCSYNCLTTLNVSGYTALTRLECYSNQLLELDVSGCVSLRYLECYDNQLIKIDVSNCTNLINLYCYNNQLIELNVSECVFLIRLKCEDNQIIELDVSENTSLQVLTCSNNQLTALDVSKNPVLVTLACGHNQLATLDVSKNTYLKNLYYDDGVTIIWYSAPTSSASALTSSQSASTLLAVLPPFTPAESGTYTFTVPIDHTPPKGTSLLLLADSEDIHGSFTLTDSPDTVIVSADFTAGRTYTPVIVATSEHQSGGCNTVTMKIVLLAGVMVLLAKKS